MDYTESSPLQWPAGWPRNPVPPHMRSPGVRVAFEKTVGRLLNDLRRLGVSEAHLTLQADMREVQAADPGVALYFTHAGAEHVMACDTYMIGLSNLRSIREVVKALLNAMDAGANAIVKQMLQGLRAGRPRAAAGAGGYTSEPGDHSEEDFSDYHRPNFSAGVDPNIPNATVAGWWHVLGFATPYSGSVKDYEKAYRERVKRAHPDVGGSKEGMALLNAAIAAAR